MSEEQREIDALVREVTAAVRRVAEAAREAEQDDDGPTHTTFATATTTQLHLVDDVYDDGIDDLVFAWRSAPTLLGSASGYEGTPPLRTFDPPNDQEELRTLLSYDLEGDGLRDLIVAWDNTVVVHLAPRLEPPEDSARPHRGHRRRRGHLSTDRGFAWLTCGPCEHHRLVPFTCGGRGFCSSCGGRRMATLSAHWVERVFARVPVRQWVLTVPWSRRWALARRPELVRRFAGLALGRVSGFLAEQARLQGIEGGRTGSGTGGAGRAP